MRDAGLVSRMRGRNQRWRRNVRAMGHDLPVTVQLKWRRAAGGRIVAIGARATDVVRVQVVATFKLVAGAANDFERCRQYPLGHSVVQASRGDNSIVQVPLLNVSER